MMKPILIKYFIFAENESADSISECCDSVIAVLSKDQIDKWLIKFDEIGLASDAIQFCDIGTITSVYNVDEKLLVVVSDAGGELASGEFSIFCDENNIVSQFIVDSIDCTGTPVDEIYTGDDSNNLELLTLLHKVYNE